MKKILLGAILASSLAMAGDLVKCSQAIDMSKKFTIAFSENENEAKDVMDNMVVREYVEKTGKVLLNLITLWNERAKVECKGILDEENYQYIKKIN